MSFFEFLMVLIGLVGAIALSVILTYLGHLIRNWQFVQNPTHFLLLIFWMVANVIGHIIGIWAYRFVDLDVYFSTFVIMSPVVIFTLAVTTLIPTSTPENETIDLDSIYFASSRSVFFLLALHCASALADDYLPGVTGAPPALFMLTMVAILLIASATKHKPTHLVLLILVIASQALPPVINALGL
jgi:hypothetical protein